MNQYKPIKVIITKEMIETAIARDPGKYNENSFKHGAGNVVGFLGEYMFQKVRPDFKHIDNFDCDFEGASKGKPITVDVKCKTQSVPFEPKGYYEASICKDSLHQKTDGYVFCRAYYDKEKDTFPYGWVIGSISRKEYFEMARYLEKGTKDGDNGYVVQQSCYNIKYSELRPLSAQLIK